MDGYLLASLSDTTTGPSHQTFKRDTIENSVFIEFAGQP